MEILRFFFIFFFFLLVNSKTFTVTNECDHPVWPVAIVNGGTPWLLSSYNTGRFVLQPGQSNTISVDLPSSGWSAFIWGRTQCSMADSGSFHCGTGDCVSDTVGCGSDSLQPASTTIAAFSLTDGLEYYQVSFKNGYNLPIIVVPLGRGSDGYESYDEQHCTTAGCAVNLISTCPPELRYSDESLGCKSACQAFAEPSFCCGTAAAFNCSTNRYTDFYKQACPKANSFANDKTSTFSCSFQQDFVIVFCPSSSTTRSTSPDYNLNTESESDSQGKITYNSKNRNNYMILALIFGALALVVALSAALWWFKAGESTEGSTEGSISLWRIIIFLVLPSRKELQAYGAFRREEKESERGNKVEITPAESDVT